MSYGPFEDADESSLADVLGTAFGFPPEDAGPWFERTGKENVRVVRHDGRAVAGLLQIPMGHFFQGSSVPTIGIAGVGVALEARAKNIGKELMQSCVREIAERKIALSTLYPATQTLYRSAGYERAGKSAEYSIPMSNLEVTVAAEGLEARLLGEEDQPALAELYSEVAREHHGALDRGPYIWSRVWAPRGRKVRGYGFYEGDRLEAYTYLSQHRPDAFSFLFNLWATDIIARSARGYASILSFCRSQRSVAENLEFRHLPSAPFLSLLKENRYDEKSEMDWMIRVTHVESALEGRGYPEGLSLTVAISIIDELVSDNHGTFTLTVRDGRGHVERGGQPEATLGVRALAQLYTGYSPCSTLSRLGLVEADPKALRKLDAIFGSPTPAVMEMF